VAFAHLLPPKGGRGLLLCKVMIGLRHFAIQSVITCFLERSEGNCEKKELLPAGKGRFTQLCDSKLKGFCFFGKERIIRG